MHIPIVPAQNLIGATMKMFQTTLQELWQNNLEWITGTQGQI